MRKYITELIGTFFLVFTICGVVLSKVALAPVAIGTVLAAMVFAGGHISGAHYNPAVTVAVFLRGRLPAREVAPYITAQLLGAALAGGISRPLFSVDRPAPFDVSGKQLVAAIVVELLVTFALAYVVLNVATSRNHPDNSFYGLAIGFTVLSGVAAFGAVSGGVFNPAVAVGIFVAGLVSGAMLPAYLVATLAGGALAALAFRALNPTDIAPLRPAAPEPPARGATPGRRRPSVQSRESG